MTFHLSATKLFLLLPLVFMTSCYSPKSEVEKDKHPEIPEFPGFDSPDVRLEKVTELKIEKETRYYLAVRGNRLFVYVTGPQDYKDEYKEQQTLLVIRKGKVTATSSWKDYPDGGSFFTTDGNLYLGNWRFYAPDYIKKKEVPYYSMDNIENDYQEANGFSRGQDELKGISEKQLQVQQELFGRIKTICQIHNEYDNKEFQPMNAVYLCNAKSGNPFYISGDFFDDVTLTKNGKEKYSRNETYVNQMRDRVSFMPEEQFFGMDSIHSDPDFFRETGSIVVGNEWYSTGNHLVGSWGYTPIYMYYYEVDYKGKVVKTKENKLKQEIAVPVKINTEWYFVSMNRAGTKLSVYYLR